MTFTRAFVWTLILCALMLLSGHYTGKMSLSIDYCILSIGILIASVPLKIAISIFRGDPVLWERNRQIISVLKKQGGSYPDLEREGLIQTGMVFNRRQNRFEITSRLSGKAIWQALRL